ncbi:hypothetical protein LV779_07445 [Streptomyces thinghirensis]|nr:hypothetical protein [Streptomyces thinghirensis]
MINSDRPAPLSAEDVLHDPGAPSPPLTACCSNGSAATRLSSSRSAPGNGQRGILTVARAGDHPAHTEAEVALLAYIGRRVGLVLDNARLYHEQQNVAETMQRQLLTPLPQVDHLRMAARYWLAESAMEVGGDWYDAFARRRCHGPGHRGRGRARPAGRRPHGRGPQHAARPGLGPPGTAERDHGGASTRP